MEMAAARHALASNMTAGRKETASVLDSQAFAALGAACVDNGTTTAGLHADQEAVGTGAADFGGLVSTFHNVLESSRPE